MSELRQNFASKEWIVIATERARAAASHPTDRKERDEQGTLASFCLVPTRVGRNTR